MEGGALMTIVEYLEKHNMTQAELSRLVGISQAAINKAVKHGGGFCKENVEKLKEFGIEARVRRYVGRAKGIRNKTKGDFNGFNGFIYFEDIVQIQIRASTEDVIYCWSKEQVDYATKLLNSKGIAYYCYYKDCYWVIHYDKNLDISDQVC